MDGSPSKRQRTSQLNKKSSKSRKRLETLRSHTDKSSLSIVVPTGIYSESGFKDVRTQEEKIRLLRWVHTS